MAQVSDVLNFARVIAQTDSNGLTDTNGIVFANEALLDFHRTLISRGVDASQLQEAYRDLTAAVGTYLYPQDMFFLKAIEVNFTDQQQNNYFVAEQVDVSNLPATRSPTSFSWLRQNEAQFAPKFDDRGDWFEIFPTPVIGNSQGIRIFYYLQPTPFASTSDQINYPSTLDYRTMGWRIASNYKRSLMDFDAADKLEAEYQKHMMQITTTLAEGSSQPNRATPILMTGWEF